MYTPHWFSMRVHTIRVRHLGFYAPQTHIHAYTHTRIHAYTHTHIHAYTHAHMHTEHETTQSMHQRDSASESRKQCYRRVPASGRQHWAVRPWLAPPRRASASSPAHLRCLAAECVRTCGYQYYYFSRNVRVRISTIRASAIISTSVLQLKTRREGEDSWQA